MGRRVEAFLELPDNLSRENAKTLAQLAATGAFGTAGTFLAQKVLERSNFQSIFDELRKIQGLRAVQPEEMAELAAEQAEEVKAMLELHKKQRFEKAATLKAKEDEGTTLSTILRLTGNFTDAFAREIEKIEDKATVEDAKNAGLELIAAAFTKGVIEDALKTIDAEARAAAEAEERAAQEAVEAAELAMLEEMASRRATIAGLRAQAATTRSRMHDLDRA